MTTDGEIPPLRQNRSFLRLVSAQGAAEAGSTMTTLAVPLLVLATTHSPLKAGAVTAASLLADVFFSLPAGALVDRHPRRRIILVTSCVGAVTSTTVCLAVMLHAVSLWFLLVTATVWSGCRSLAKGALAAGIRSTVGPSQRPRALSVRQAQMQGVELAAPPIGGALYGIRQALPFGVDAVAYTTCALLVWGWQEAFTPNPRVTSILHDIREGGAYILTAPWRRHFVTWAMLLNFGGIGISVCLNLRLAQHGIPAAHIGLIDGVAGGAALCGALLAPRIIERVDTGRLTLLTTMIGAVSFAIAGATFTLPVVAFFSALGAFLFPANNAALGAFMQNQVPDEMQGRTNGAVGFFVGILMPAASLLAGWVIDLGFGSWAGVLFSSVVLASVIPILKDPILRTLPRPSRWEEATVHGTDV